MIESWMQGLVPEDYEKTYFDYNDKASSEMGLTIGASTSQHSPGYDVMFEKVPGRDGDLAMDNGRFEPFVYPIRVYLESEGEDIHAAASRISKWLKKDIRYKPLFLSWDPEYIYSAIYYEQYDIEDMLQKFGKISLNFKCHPIKYALSGLTKRDVSIGSTLYNPEERTAKPLIEITGTGDILLFKNGEPWLTLTGVDGSITIDSQTQMVYKGDVKAFNKMNGNLRPMFPVLSPGENVISWGANVGKVTITPRWEAVV
ncbi:hypothetical protein DHX103_14485 [Planococcus sp. X10-3]|uniref:hypothetical protein n=1 Tax=Planococcus sp. X10-3 TaxID=3061240 RepID=UPI003BAE9CBB